MGAVPAGPDAPEGPRSPADRRPGGAVVQLRAARGHRRSADSRRGAQVAQARPGSAQRVHAARRRAVASRRPVDLADAPPERPPSGLGPVHVIGGEQPSPLAARRARGGLRAPTRRSPHRRATHGRARAPAPRSGAEGGRVRDEYRRP